MSEKKYFTFYVENETIKMTEYKINKITDKSYITETGKRRDKNSVNKIYFEYGYSARIIAETKEKAIEIYVALVQNFQDAQRKAIEKQNKEIANVAKLINSAEKNIEYKKYEVVNEQQTSSIPSTRQP